MHASNDLQELVERAKQHKKLFGEPYKVKDTYGNVVWEGNDNEKA